MKEKKEMSLDEILDEMERCLSIVQKSQNWKCQNDYNKRYNRLKKMYYAKLREKNRG